MAVKKILQEQFRPEITDKKEKALGLFHQGVFGNYSKQKFSGIISPKARKTTGITAKLRLTTEFSAPTERDEVGQNNETESESEETEEMEQMKNQVHILKKYNVTVVICE